MQTLRRGAIIRASGEVVWLPYFRGQDSHMRSCIFLLKTKRSDFVRILSRLSFRYVSRRHRRAKQTAVLRLSNSAFSSACAWSHHCSNDVTHSNYRQAQTHTDRSLDKRCAVYSIQTTFGPDELTGLGWSWTSRRTSSSARVRRAVSGVFLISCSCSSKRHHPATCQNNLPTETIAAAPWTRQRLPKMSWQKRRRTATRPVWSPFCEPELKLTGSTVLDEPLFRSVLQDAPHPFCFVFVYYYYYCY